MFIIDRTNSVLAQATNASGGSFIGILPIILMFVILYFLMIRPQMKRQREHRELITNLAKGDEITTTGGLLGKVSRINHNYIILEISELAEKPIEVAVQKVCVLSLLPKGTVKSL